MRIYTNPDVLAKKIDLLSGYISKDASHYICTMLHMFGTKDSDTIYFEAYDFSVFGKVPVKLKTPLEASINICLPKSFSEIIKHFAKGDEQDLIIEFEQEKSSLENNLVIKLKTEFNSLTTSVKSAEDYPNAPNTGVEVINATIPISSFLTAINRVSFAVVTDTAKYVLNGVNLAFSGDNITLAATNGHCVSVVKIHECDIGNQQSGKIVDTTIAISQIKKLVTLLRHYANDVKVFELKVFPQYVLIAIEDGLTLIIKTCADTYPAYEKLVPNTFDGTFSVDKPSIARAIALAQKLSTMAIVDRKLVKVKMLRDDNNSPMLSLELTEDSLTSTEYLPIDTQYSKPMEIGFNPDYLHKAISTFNADSLEINFNTPESPVVFKGVDDFYSAYILIMPVRLTK